MSGSRFLYITFCNSNQERVSVIDTADGRVISTLDISKTDGGAFCTLFSHQNKFLIVEYFSKRVRLNIALAGRCNLVWRKLSTTTTHR